MIGKTWRTEQLCYVATGINRLILSKECRQKLRMIPGSFPVVGASFQPGSYVTEIDAPVLTDNESFNLTPNKLKLKNLVR